MTPYELAGSKWEYRFERLGDGDLTGEIRVQVVPPRRLEPGMSLEQKRPRAEDKLNALGREGWELVTLSSGRPVVAVLKRPLY